MGILNFFKKDGKTKVAPSKILEDRLEFIFPSGYVISEEKMKEFKSELEILVKRYFKFKNGSDLAVKSEYLDRNKTMQLDISAQLESTENLIEAENKSKNKSKNKNKNKNKK